MTHARLLHDLLDHQRRLRGDAQALVHGSNAWSYAQLGVIQDAVAAGLRSLGLAPSERVGVFLSKSVEAAAVPFGCSKAGGTFVPINPLAKPRQVAHIVRDCGMRVLVTSPERLATLSPVLSECDGLKHIVVTKAKSITDGTDADRTVAWDDLLSPGAPAGFAPRLEIDMAAILYTSGSTGLPKGVVVSHRNLVTGARSVASYLGNDERDRLLAALPLSFDAGFSQLTTAFHAGGCAVLLEYLTPGEVLGALVAERITGMTAVPPLWIQLAQLEWPAPISESLRYFANTGGKMPLDTLARLRSRVPHAKPFLMYGLTEAFRSTYLPPEEVGVRPHSIGKAIPDQEILVLRPNGTPCEPQETGELVHRGSTVALGYWGDPERTAERFKPLPTQAAGLPLPEFAVFSGDMVKRDEQGFLYFVGRRDEMIKSSGYRISPVEIEEAAYATGQVTEVAAFGVPDERLGQAIVLVCWPALGRAFDLAAFRAALGAAVPAYMRPTMYLLSDTALPRNGNGKIDRLALARQHADGASRTTEFT